MISIGLPNIPSATSFRFVIVKNNKAIAKPYYIRAMRKSVKYIAFLPNAAYTTSAKDILPCAASLA
jgi:hypothetical protein